MKAINTTTEDDGYYEIVEMQELGKPNITLQGKKPYLIQRCCFNKSAKLIDVELGRLTINGFLSFDYMGSAEFEFGALPTSRKFIEKYLSEYIITEIPEIESYYNKKLAVFHHKDFDIRTGIIQHYEESYLDSLLELSKDKAHLKEWTNLHKHIRETKDIRGNVWDHTEENIWWDIETHIFFSFEKEILAYLPKVIENTRIAIKCAK